MVSWLEILGVIFVAFLGIYLGRLSSSLKKPYWLVGYFTALVPIVLLALSLFFNSLHFIKPFSWLVTGRVKFAVLAITVTMGLTTPLSRLPHRFEKVMVCLLGFIVVIWFSILPFLVPLLVKDNLSNLETIVDLDGICYQTTDYTCGPAAAVTALRRLDLPADEGEIAILSYSSPITGTLPKCLYKALKKRYRNYGLSCQYRHFDSVGQLRNNGLVLAVVKEKFLLDHCVVVLDVTEEEIIVADPVTGRQRICHEDFEKVWRFSGITLKRDKI